MRSIVNKRAIAIAVLGTILSIGSFKDTVVYAAPVDNTTVSVTVDVQQKEFDAGVIHWEKGSDADVVAMGNGLPPENAGQRGKFLARRAAIVDAYRNLLETVNGVSIDAETTMQDLVVASDAVNAKVSGLIKNARIIEEGLNADGSYYVKMSVPMFGSTQSLAAVAVPEITKGVAPQPMPTVTRTELLKADVKEVRSAQYTGVVIDATGLGLEPTFSPAIYDVNGRVVYGIQNLNYDLAISKGMVDYANEVELATSGARAGANPLVIKALSVRGGKNSVSNVNVVISEADADRILLANESSGMLENCSVVFVK